jgi:hypothetical protein
MVARLLMELFMLHTTGAAQFRFYAGGDRYGVGRVHGLRAPRMQAATPLTGALISAGERRWYSSYTKRVVVLPATATLCHVLRSVVCLV